MPVARARDIAPVLVLALLVLVVVARITTTPRTACTSGTWSYSIDDNAGITSRDVCLTYGDGW